MKFLIDAQLPRRIARFLRGEEYDVTHTQDLPDGNATAAAEINRISVQEQRVVVTKDADFVQSFLLQQKPYKLLLVATGNIKNSELDQLFQKNINQLVDLFESHSYLELGRDAIVIHQ